MIQNLKISACFMQNFMELDKKNVLDPKAVTFQVQGLKTSLGQFGSKGFIKSPESKDEYNKIMKS